jgi:hypothetical protein
MKKPSAPLPPACPLCRPYGGRWRSVEGGLARCLCPRGEALAAGKVKQRPSLLDGSTSLVRLAPPVQQHDGKMAATGED